MPSRQPTHHGYAVDVKDRHTYDFGPLSEEEAQSLYDEHAESFWDVAQSIARDHGFEGVWSEGRSGGWAQPYPQPHTDDMWEHEVDAWMEERFRPFEADLLALMDDTRADFLSNLAGAIESAEREPAED